MDGSVLDAARLNADQIATYLPTIESSPMSADELATTQAQLTAADPSAVTDEQLLNPPEAVKPTSKLASFAAGVAKTSINPRDALTLFGLKHKRQYLCTFYGYCTDPSGPLFCYINSCDCNGVFCQQG